MNPAAPEDVVVALVGRPWGTRGQFLLDPRGSDPEFLLARGSLRLRRGGQPTVECRLVGSHVAGGRLVVGIEGCATVEEAESLRGAEVVVRPDDFNEAPSGSYYPHQLLGMEVLDASGRSLGRVESVIGTGGCDLLAVKDGDRERLIPFAETICRKIDPAKGRIEIDPPEGLLELD